ncbi:MULTISPECIES: DUF3267 domain-containing protein [unclassified Bacillus cereus group]|uniref:DUF3267 domain-containing protein n=1 Tax=unclassified Bacillus cereus group TaxID=2750818 RepID=UPI001F574415|nr:MULTISPECIES: DUF3267 domain-containing protein [unclassified Bacillus cereus group]
MEHRKETTVSISMFKLNIYAIVFIIVMMMGVAFLHIFLFETSKIVITLPSIFMLIIAMFALVCIHEALHLIGFHYIGGVAWSELKWGVNFKLGVAYAHSRKPIFVKHMKKVLMLPLLPTGILPIVVGVAMNFPVISLLGVLLTAGCIGDLALYRKVSKFPDNAFVIDHPTKPQFTVYE